MPSSFFDALMRPVGQTPMPVGGNPPDPLLGGPFWEPEPPLPAPPPADYGSIPPLGHPRRQEPPTSGQGAVFYPTPGMSWEEIMNLSGALTRPSLLGDFRRLAGPPHHRGGADLGLRGGLAPSLLAPSPGPNPLEAVLRQIQQWGLRPAQFRTDAPLDWTQIDDRRPRTPLPYPTDWSGYTGPRLPEGY